VQSGDEQAGGRLSHGARRTAGAQRQRAPQLWPANFAPIVKREANKMRSYKKEVAERSGERENVAKPAPALSEAKRSRRDI
jgi:hypothetical protein